MINIPDSDFKQILSVIGYPIVTLEDLGIAQEDILDIMIDPAMNYFFTYFPKLNEQTYQISTSFNIAYPSDNTFTAVDVRINPNLRLGGAKSMSPLVNEYNIRISNGSRKRMWGTENDYGYSIVRIMEEQERQAGVNRVKTFNFNVDEYNRQVTGYSSIFGTLKITWAEKIDNWQEIPLYRKRDALDICQIYVLEYFGGLRNQAVSSMPVEMTGESFLSRASEMREKLETRWKEITKVKIIRG